MPRVATAIGVVATMAFCIWLNVSRYPMVWHMVTVPSRAADADNMVEPSDSASATQSSLADESATTAPDDHIGTGDMEQSTSSTPIPRDTSDVVTSPLADATSDSVSTHEGTYRQNSIGDRGEGSSSRYVSSPIGVTTERRSTSGKRLVPVTGLMPNNSTTQSSDSGSYRFSRTHSGQSGFSNKVQRLPPLDRTNEDTSMPPLPRSPYSPIPIYPTTGI